MLFFGYLRMGGTNSGRYMTTKLIGLTDIQADPRAQPRTTVFTEKIGEYVEDMKRGDNFPPLAVFFDGETNWLADGFHRYFAAKAAELNRFACEIRQGGLREAVLYSCGANAAHGIRRTNADRRRAVFKLFDDSEWSKWSDHEISRHCYVSSGFVTALRKEYSTLTGNIVSGERTYRTKHGTISTMQTAGINAGRQTPPMSPDRLASSLRDLERIIESLPAPFVLVAKFPNEQRYHFPISKLDEMARWMTELAHLWREEMRESA